MIGQGFLSRSLDFFGIAPQGGLRSAFNSYVVMKRAERDAHLHQARLTYAQFGEDAVLQSYLPDSTGTYIDIGAGHPVRGSNTYALYKRGWRGILVDPIATNSQLARKVRPQDHVVNALCGDEEQADVLFYEYDIYEYSTVLPDRVSELASLGHIPRNSYVLPVTTLAKLTKGLDVRGTTVLSIDVEGFELNVLQGNDWNAFRPDFILVEEWEPPVRRSTEVFELLTQLDYEFIAYAGASSLYRLQGHRKSALP